MENAVGVTPSRVGRALDVAAGWFLGVVFGLAGLLLLTSGFLVALPVFGIACLWLPPVRAKVYSKTGMALSGKARAVGVLLLIGLSVYFANERQAREQAALAEAQALEAAQLAKARREEDARRQEEFRKEFVGKKEEILAAGRASLDAGDPQGASTLLSKYAANVDADLQGMLAEAKERIAAKEAEAETLRLLSELKGVAESNIVRRANVYARLSKLNPTRADYAEKAASLAKQVAAREEANRVAALKAEAARKAAQERKARIESQFSSWDGSNRALEEVVKRSMNNPDSYEHVKTTYRDMGDHLLVVSTFRGTNAFGGVVTNTVKAKVNLEGDHVTILKTD